MDKLKIKCINLLKSRGVEIDDIADCSRFLQEQYHENLTKEPFIEIIDKILEKREVQYAILTGITLDVAAEKDHIDDKDLQDDLLNDKGLYGVDEVIAYGICNLYGSIALTNFGYIDKCKYGIVGELNELGKEDGRCHTFLDDIVGAIASAAAAVFAHQWNDKIC